ncbi:hypothetical protein L2Y96_21200 [Luteibacter aegosomaticola]|uniref:hypothetical protein n=1 Tax=Luteibacter aegosomaticola TaxID=2911538 RepID=UPI001FF766D7|nr:hypothetical protein [Luteibacter aegosomaticola]UPG89875.1 hypothetical protein L2Y96_21200 [Luteibacter aegosomaticola]
MHISKREASLVQGDLFLFSISEYCPDMLIGGRGAASDPWRWQYAVDVLHSGFESGLLTVWTDQGAEACGSQVLSDLVRMLSESDPFDMSQFLTGGLDCWLEPQVVGTDICDDMLRRNGVDRSDGELSATLIADIEALLRKRSCPWGSGPRIIGMKALSGESKG